MKRTLAALSLLGFSLAGAPSVLAKVNSTTVNMTGCLAQGTESHDYSIRDTDGRTYDLPRTDVRLKKHVGHEVMLTGVVMKNKSTNPDERLRVTQVKNVKLIADTCNK
jgi:hypothetical protein